MTTPLLADSGFIIWLVILAIFGIGQMLNKGSNAAKKRGPPRGPRQRPPALPPGHRRPGGGGPTAQERNMAEKQAEAQRLRSQRQARRTQARARQQPPPRTRQAAPTMEEQMRALYKQLTGEDAGPPATARRPAAPAAPVRDDRIKLKPKAPPPQPPTIQLKPAPQPAAPDAFSIVEDYKEIAELSSVQDAMDSHTGGAHNTLGTRNMMIDMGRMNIPLIRIPLMSMDTLDNVQDKPNLHDRRTLRDAVLARVILEPPKALQPLPTEDANQL